ncbi:MAG: hypothetical protein AAFR79_10555 [Pseudomonadota bacterium]
MAERGEQTRSIDANVEFIPTGAAQIVRCAVDLAWHLENHAEGMLQTHRDTYAWLLKPGAERPWRAIMSPAAVALINALEEAGHYRYRSVAEAKAASRSAAVGRGAS